MASRGRWTAGIGLLAAASWGCGPTLGAGDAEGSGEGSTSIGSPTTGTDEGRPPSTSTSTTGEMSTGSSGGSLDTGIFLVPPDGGVCVGAPSGTSFHCLPCDVWDQDCGDGTKCAPWANDGGRVWNDTKCAPLDPTPAAVGEPCSVENSDVSGIDSCALGAICWDVDPDMHQGICVAHCGGDEASPVCPEETTCAIFNYNVLPLCLPPCDPLASTCAEGSTCRPDGDDGFVCLPVGTHGLVDDGCAEQGGCGVGELCGLPELIEGCEYAEGCCTVYCDLADPMADEGCAAASPGHVCRPYYEPGQAPGGLEQVGVCILPP